MEHFSIDYFGEKTLGYFGTRDGAIEYAEYAQRMGLAGALSCEGEIVIADDYGNIVATQEWRKQWNEECAWFEWVEGEWSA